MPSPSSLLRVLFSVLGLHGPSTVGDALPCDETSNAGRHSSSSESEGSVCSDTPHLDTKRFDITTEAGRNQLRNILHSFVSSVTGTAAVFESPDTAVLEAACMEEMSSVNMDYNLVAKWFRWACQVANNFYPNHPLELRVLIVLCNLAIFYIDDILVTDPQLLYSFQLALITHQPQRDPILRCLANELIPRMWRYFDPAAANAIAVGFYEFIIGTSMEADVRNMHLSPSAPDFPSFVRIKSGAPAQYAHWLFYSPTRESPNDYIQAVPDFLVIINHVNDILSFYKEELAGEEDNLVHMRARTLGKSVLATLADLCAETEERINRVCQTLATAPETQAVFKGFMVRYIHFHTSTTRYRLQELLA